MLRKISERDAQFLSLPPAERRVAIARDVIRQVEGGQLKPEPGTFIHRYTHWRAGERVDASCGVCALGAMAVSLLDGEAESDGAQIRGQLAAHFGHVQVALIESAFEGWDRGDALAVYRAHSHFGDEELRDIDRHAVDFTDAMGLTGRERMLLIMRNIVENGGEFVPDRFLDALEEVG